MVLIRECDESGKVIDPTDPAEREQLRKDCLRHATGPNGVIDWVVYNLGLYGENLFSDLSSESSVDSSSDSDYDSLLLQERIAGKTFVERFVCSSHLS
jgi:hypothetical protein